MIGASIAVLVARKPEPIQEEHIPLIVIDMDYEDLRPEAQPVEKPPTATANPAPNQCPGT